MNSSYDHANRGYDIPPPPPRPQQWDLGSLCPPPPPPPSDTNTTGSHPQFQSMPLMQMQHHQNVTRRHQTFGLSTGNYQMQQYHFPQNFHHPNHQAYPQYSIFFTPPPPPPPPPPQPQSLINSTHNIRTKGERHNARHTHKNHKYDKHTNLCQGGVESDKTEDAKTNKKINPKMAKKYSGRGLKTITISGPGMPTQKFKICVGNHPDDVKKWIEERRKRFPRVSANNTRAVASSENSVGGHMSAETVGGKRGRETEFCSVNVTLKKQCTKDVSSDEILADRSATCGGVLSSLLSGYESSSTQEESGTANIHPDGGSAKEDATLRESSTEISSDIKSTTPSQIIEVGSVRTTSLTGSTRICRFFKRGNCRHGDSCKFLHVKPDGNTSEMSRDSKIKTQSERDKAIRRYESELHALGLVNLGQTNSNGHKRVGQFVSNTSLLSKLLQRDRERERRLTLQLLRYITDCDYFQSGNNAESILDDRASDERFETNEQPVTDKNGNPDSQK